MKKIISIIMVMAIAAVCAFASGSSETASAEAKAKVAVMFGTGGLGDQSFNDNIYNAVVNAQNTLDFEFDYVEPKATSDFETVLTEFAQEKTYKVIIIAGSDASEALAKVSKNYPSQLFAIVDSSSCGDNVLGITFKDNESTYLGGYAAALISKTGKIGVIGAMDIDVINGFIAGWEAGAKAAKSDIEVFRMYCGSFSDPVTAKEMAIQMYSNGADIVFGAAGGSGLGIFQAAEETDNLAVGVDSNQNPVKPDYIVMSCVRSFTTVIYDTIEGAINGTLKGGETKACGIVEDAVDCTFEGSNVVVDSSVKDAIAALKEEVKAGKISIPTSLN